MSEEEIEKAIKKWDIYDEYYNFDTLKSTYALYCMVCFFENRKLKVVRIISNKAETKIFKPRKFVEYALV